MGVSQVGVRKRIMDGVLEIHKKQWDMPRNNLPYNRAIRCQFAILLMNYTPLRTVWCMWLSQVEITYLWQSCVEIEGYSIVYFEHIAVLEAPHR